MHGDAYHIDLDTTIRPVQHVPWRVPVVVKEPLKQKLAELTKQGIITEVEESTPWISNMVVILKPNKLTPETSTKHLKDQNTKCPH